MRDDAGGIPLAARPSSAKWRVKHRAIADSLEEAGDRLFTFARLPPSQWRSVRTTNAGLQLLRFGADGVRTTTSRSRTRSRTRPCRTPATPDPPIDPAGRPEAGRRDPISPRRTGARRSHEPPRHPHRRRPRRSRLPRRRRPGRGPRRRVARPRGAGGGPGGARQRRPADDGASAPPARWPSCSRRSRSGRTTRPGARGSASPTCSRRARAATRATTRRRTTCCARARTLEPTKPRRRRRARLAGAVAPRLPRRPAARAGGGAASRTASRRRRKAIVGDAEIELGRYPQAFRTIDELGAERPSLVSYARQSYALELQGDLPRRGRPDGATRSPAAPAAARARSGRACSTRALLIKLGRLDDAQQELQHALAALPHYARAEAGLGAVAVARGDLAAAERWYKQAAGHLPLAEILVALGDVQTARGETRRGEEQLRAGAAPSRTCSAPPAATPTSSWRCSTPTTAIAPRPSAWAASR